MEDLVLVQHFQTFDYLNENSPDLLFFQVGLLLLVLCDFLVQVALVRVLHHDTNPNKMRDKPGNLPQTLRSLIDECLMVATDRLMLNAGQDANFV